MISTPRIPPALIVMACACVSPVATGQSIEGLVFNQPIHANNANHPVLGDYYTGTTFDFINVLPASDRIIDARVTVSGITSGRYSFGGTFPDYGGEGDDLGFLYSYSGGSGAGGNFGEGGVTYQLEFFEGGGGFVTPAALSNFSLLIYDIDGELSQSESVTAFTRDGLSSYRLSDSNALELMIDDGSYRFAGPYNLYDPSDSAAAVILTYANTSSIQLRMTKDTNGMSPNNNAIFGGIDGDPGGTAGFGLPVMLVPEPSAALLACGGLFPLFRRPP